MFIFLSMYSMHFLDQILVRSTWYRTFFIKHGEYPSSLCFNQFQTLNIISKCNIGHINSFLLIFCLLLLEDIIIKMLLQFLICIIDAKLFEIIFFEYLKAKDIKNTYSQFRWLFVESYPM